MFLSIGARKPLPFRGGDESEKIINKMKKIMYI